MDPIEIEKGIPIPVRRERYPFDRMEVGDSIFAPNAQDVILAMSRYARDNFVRFDTQSESKGGKVGLRVWRTL